MNGINKAWHLQRLTTQTLPLRNVYDPINDGTGATVYLVDSGIVMNMDEFSDAKIEMLHTTSATGNFSETAPAHGTKLAALIVGNTLGVSPGATLKVVKLTETSKTDTSIDAIVDCLDVVLQDHLNTPDVTKVVNLSWVTARNEALENKITELTDNNLVVVCASGDNGSDVAGYAPAGMTNVITVGPTDKFDRVCKFLRAENEVTPNFGAIDIFAPGIGVTVVGPFTANKYGESSGSSLSAAIVSGIVAQVIEANPGKRADEIKQIVLDTAQTDMVFMVGDDFKTASNRLAHAQNMFYRNVWSTTESHLADYSNATTGNFEIEMIDSDDVVSLTSTDFALLPPFMEIVGTKVIVSPSKADVAGIYQVILEATTNDGSKFTKFIEIGIFIESVIELNSVEDYYYVENSDGNPERVLSYALPNQPPDFKT